MRQERQCAENCVHVTKLLAVEPTRKYRSAKSLRVIDLGSGNGALLRRIGPARAVGIEADPQRAARGRKAGSDVRTGRIQDIGQLAQEQFDVALISQRRLEEMTAAERFSLRGWLLGHTWKLLVYSYDEPKFASLVKVKP